MAGGFDNATIDQYAAFLKAYWKLSDVNDSINTHTLANTDVDFTQAGIRGNCGTFDGNDKLAAASSADFNLFGNDWCISYFFNQAADMGAGTYAYFSIGADNNDILECSVDNKRLSVSIRTASALAVTIRGGDSPGDWNPSAGWHHMMIARKSNDYYLHIDGAQNSTVNDADQMENANQPVNIGHYIAINYYYTGKIDEKGIWNGLTFADEAAVDALAAAIWNGSAGRFWSDIISSYLTRDVGGVLDRTASGVLVRVLT